MFFCDSVLYYRHVIIMDTMACIFGVCIISNFMLNVWWRFLTVNLQYTCYFLDLFQIWTISCQIWLILFLSVAINNNNLHKNVQCNSNQSNENLPLTCKTSENNDWFLCLCFALIFDCQSFLPNRFVILLSTGLEGCIMQRNVRYVGELHCVLSSCKLCSLNVFGNLSENTWKLLNMYTVCCSKYW